MAVLATLRCASCGKERPLTKALLSEIASRLDITPRKLTRQRLEAAAAKFRCTACGAKQVTFLFAKVGSAGNHTMSTSGNIQAARRYAESMYGKPKDEYSKRYVDEGIAGTREDVKKAQANVWSETINRAK